MRDICERPESKFASLPLAGNWANTTLHTVFDGSLLFNADDEKTL